MNSDPGNRAVIDIIRAEIRRRGPVSFSWFMQQALYHPEHGYYSSGRAAIGRTGDYFTNVSVGPLFGRLLAAQFVEIWERLGKIDSFTIVEQGAHDGYFARDVLASAQERWPNFFEAVRYQIVEPFPAWKDRQRKTLEPFRSKVEWPDSMEPINGIRFSNELIDAMPIDLRGKLVDLDRDRFVLVERSDESPAKPNQVALDWVDNVARNLIRGCILIIDYGFVGEEFREVVQTRSQHRVLDSPFEQIGHADITAHVNWSSIATRAKDNGLSVAGFTDQHHFLTGIISAWPELTKENDPKTTRALQTLLHPEMLGRSFQVLALSKAVDTGARLAGFRFARHHEL